MELNFHLHVPVLLVPTTLLIALLAETGTSLTLDEIISASKGNSSNHDINLPNSPNMVKVEMDMILSRTEWQEMQRPVLMNTQPERGRRQKRKAIQGVHMRWSRRIVPYVIGEGFSLKERNEILAAIGHWRERTCIDFREKQRRNRNYIYFEPDPLMYYGCASHVGMIRGRQNLYLSRGCRKKEVIIHEIGHAIGFYHEQSRPDRDNYVTIKWENVEHRQRHNFQKFDSTINNHDVPYDYFSIMHYGSKYFSKNDRPTVVPKDLDFLDTIGTATTLSDKDIQLVNAMYRCGEGTAASHNEACYDLSPFKCRLRARLGHCSRKTGFMVKHCRKTCGKCGVTE